MDVMGDLRVSTDEQARSGLGLEDQRQRVQQEIERRSWSVAWSVDDAYSASSLSRPGITTALEELRARRAQALVVSKLDRLSRSLIDFASLMESAKREGWALIALDLGVDMTTPAGEMMASVMASFAQYERRLIAERTKDALAVLKSRGRKLGRPVAVLPSTSAAIGTHHQNPCKHWWRRWESNPRPPACKAGALAN